MGTMSIHGVSGETKVISMMDKIYSLKNQGPAQKNLTEAQTLEIYECVSKCCSY